MFKKRIILLGASLLLISCLLAACSTDTGGVESQLGIVVSDAEATDLFTLEPTESDAPGASLDYMDYIRPLGYLMNGKSWAEPTDIPPVDMLIWYALYERDQNGVDIAKFHMEDEGGYRFPQKSVEDSIAKYFGSMVGHFRGDDGDEIFDPENGEYIMSSELPEFSQSIFLTKIEEQGKLRILYFSVTIDQVKQDYMLTLTDEGDSIQYHSLTGPNGEIDTPALITVPAYGVDKFPENADSIKGPNIDDMNES